MASSAAPVDLSSSLHRTPARPAEGRQAASDIPGPTPAYAAYGLGARVDRHLAAIRHTLSQAPSLKATAKAFERNAWAVMPGAAVTLASGYGFAATVTPKLLAISAQAAGLAEGLRTVPVVGGMLAQALGCGGHFGLWGGAACIFSATVALLTGKGPWDCRAKWAAAHLAQGFATSPFWTMAAAGTLPGALPGLVVAAACMLGVSLVLAQVLNNGRPSWLSGVAMTSLSGAGGPLGGALGGGLAGSVPVYAAAAGAGLSLAIGALTAAFLIYRSHINSFDDDSTALLRRYEMTADLTRHLDLSGAQPEKASVFVDDQNFYEQLQSLRVNLAAGGEFRAGHLLLCGPPGTGKTDVAKGLQNFFGWRFFCVPASLILDDAAPASKITEFMEQAAQIAKIGGQPVGLVFDEAEKLLPDRGRFFGAQGARDAAAWSMTNTFNDLFGGLLSSKYNHVFTVVITNHPEATDPAFLSRFGGQSRLDLQLPTPAIRRKIFRSRWRTNHLKYRPLARFDGYVPNDEDTLALEAACGPKQHHLSCGKQIRMELSGRDLNEAVNASLNVATVRFGENASHGTQADFEALLREQFLLAVRKHFADKSRDAEARARVTAAPSETPREFSTQIASALAGPAGDRLAEKIAVALRGAPEAGPQAAGASGRASEGTVALDVEQKNLGGVEKPAPYAPRTGL